MYYWLVNVTLSCVLVCGGGVVVVMMFKNGMKSPVGVAWWLSVYP